VAVPFQAIKAGNKTIESRLYDEKRQKIKIGDTLIFINREASEQKVEAKVVGLLHYATFKELFTHNIPAKFGGASAEWLLSQIEEFYSIEDQSEHGVIGIEFQISNE
jgi:ASC-1-like (ASCH) protein